MNEMDTFITPCPICKKKKKRKMCYNEEINLFEFENSSYSSVLSGLEDL